MDRAHRSAHAQQPLGRRCSPRRRWSRWPRSAQVGLLALTDHDTAPAATQARAACEAHGIASCRGVELTCRWRGREIHVVGLDIDRAHPPLVAHCARVLELRRERVTQHRRSACRAPDCRARRWRTRAGRRPRPPACTWRARCARADLATPVQAAFDRWLKRGRPGYVAPRWPELAAAVRCIIDAGGSAGARPPAPLSASSGALRELLRGIQGGRRRRTRGQPCRHGPGRRRARRQPGAPLRAARLDRLGFPRARPAMASAGSLR